MLAMYPPTLNATSTCEAGSIVAEYRAAAAAAARSTDRTFTAVRVLTPGSGPFPHAVLASRTSESDARRTLIFPPFRCRGRSHARYAHARSVDRSAPRLR